MTRLEQAKAAAIEASIALRQVQRELEGFTNDQATAQQQAISAGKNAPPTDGHRLFQLTRKYGDLRKPWCEAMDELQAALDEEREEA